MTVESIVVLERKEFMDKYIRVGIGVMILDGNKVLLGHRYKDRKVPRRDCLQNQHPDL